jgi:hypothetical protein
MGALEALHGRDFNLGWGFFCLHFVEAALGF